LTADLYHPYKNRSQSSKPITPTFQYSIIPLSRVTVLPIFSDLAQRTRSSVL
jgi:hypothetical protein